MSDLEEGQQLPNPLTVHSGTPLPGTVAGRDESQNTSVALSAEAELELSRLNMPVPESWEKRGSVVKGPDHYKRPTVVLEKLATTNPGVAKKLQGARDRGLLPDSAVTDIANIASADPAVNPYAVPNLPLEVRIAFRSKLLGLLLLNLTTVLGILFLIQFTPALNDFFVDHMLVGLFAFASFALSLTCMLSAKDQYPWNYVSLLFFTLSFGAFFGNPAGFNSYSNFQFVGTAASHIFFLRLLTTNKIPGVSDKFPEEGGYMFLPLAALLSYLLTLILVIIIQTTWFLPAGLGTVPHFLTIQFISIGTIMYFSYDTQKIEENSMADGYMDGVIRFYTDFVTVVLCGCCIALFSGG
jgi:hypothetical protein